MSAQFGGIVVENEPHKKMKTLLISLSIAVVSILGPIASPGIAAAGTTCGNAKDGAVKVSVDIGCKGVGNPIMDALFAIIRFLSDGVGLVVIASIVWAGIQYSASKGNPSETAKAIQRIQNTLIALLIYIFGYALLNYIIPAGVLK